MFRPMRRIRQQLSQAECDAILQKCSSGVLAVAGDDGYPYTVPMSYLYQDGRLYFHCAKSGHKLDAVRREPKVSFCVVGQDDVVPERFTTHYQSVVAFGRIRVLEDAQEAHAATDALMRRYAPASTEACRTAEITREMLALSVWEMTIDHMTGKEAIELLRARG